MSLRANLSLREQNWRARHRKKLLSRHRASLQKNDLEQSDPPPVTEPPPVESTKNVLTTTQWLSVSRIFVSLAEIYYKREEIKSLLAKPQTQANTMLPAPPHSPVDAAPQANTPLEKKEVSVKWIKLSFRFNIWINQKSKHSCFIILSYMGRSGFFFFQISAFFSSKKLLRATKKDFGRDIPLKILLFSRIVMPVYTGLFTTNFVLRMWMPAMSFPKIVNLSKDGPDTSFRILSVSQSLTTFTSTQFLRFSIVLPNTELFMSL